MKINPRKHRRKLLAVAITGGLVISLVSSQSCLAATIVVNNSSDAFFPIGSQSCTLRAAIGAANMNFEVGGCPAGSFSQVDVINVDAGLAGATITLQAGPLMVNSSLTINGPNPTEPSLNISGNNTSQIFTFRESISATTTDVYLNGLTLTNGRVTESNGGALNNVGQNLTLNSCMLSDNAANAGSISTGRGGAINNSGQLRLNNSTVSGNSAESNGGGIRHYGQSLLTLTNTTVSDNSGSYGAAISAEGPTNVESSTLSGNSASDGGGAILVANDVSVTHSTIVNNSARNGAAVYGNTGSLVRFNTVTISNNAASGDPGVVAAVSSYSSVTMVNSTLVGNAPSAIARGEDTAFWGLINTVIADSTVIDCVDTPAPLNQNYNSLIGDGSCATGVVNMLVGDPFLGPLADNGGVTLTHAPLTGSPLVDVGNLINCPSTDQTLMPRPIDGNGDGDAQCDIGSVEFVDLFAPLTSLSNVPTITSPGATSLELEVTYTDLDGPMDAASADPADINIIPGPLSVTGVALSGSASALTVTYTVVPPGGGWGFGDSGGYTVNLNANQVFDAAVTGANSVPAMTLGSFLVAIAEIDVSGAGNSIVNGDNNPISSNQTAFGDVVVNTSTSRTFEISNIGSGTISLTGALELIGEGFSITQPAATRLASGELTSFVVSVTPSAPGPITSQVLILNSDSDENPYTFAVNATGIELEEVIYRNGFEFQD